VDRTLALEHAPRGHELREVAEDVFLVSGIHGQIRGVPFSQHAEPDELLALDADVFQGIVAARPSR
jgi:hypothetical protein